MLSVLGKVLHCSVPVSNAGKFHRKGDWLLDKICAKQSVIIFKNQTAITKKRGFPVGVAACRVDALL